MHGQACADSLLLPAPQTEDILTEAEASLVRQQGLEGAGPSRTGGRGPRLADFPTMEQASVIEAVREVDASYRPRDTTMEGLQAMKVGEWRRPGCMERGWCLPLLRVWLPEVCVCLLAHACVV
jgi:hypothetical protein